MNIYQIKTINKISKKGLDKFGADYLISNEVEEPDAILVRSASMHDMDFPASLHCISRAGAGVNNIPVEKCAEKGIVVFNAPGANANAVKELAIAALLISSRKIVDGILWTKTLSGNDIAKQVEKGKSQFVGPELKGKVLGVLGLGAIGAKVANTAVNLDMEVLGYDPFISIDAAWGLSTSVKRAKDLKTIFDKCDYITLHLPLTDDTNEMLNKETFVQMRKGVRIINLSRGELVNDDDMKAALEEGKVYSYVTDFPDEKLLNVPGVISIPHLGASTPESEDNSAVMVAMETKDFLENGNIKNSVNFPNCEMGICETEHRITIAHRNIPKMLGRISSVLSEQGANIANMINKSRGNYAYTIIDAEEIITSENVQKIQDIEGVLKVRVI